MDAHRRWAVANRNVRNPLRDRSRNCFRVYISDRRLINSILARVVFARARTRGNFKRSVFSVVTQPYLSDFSTFAGRCDLARALDIQRLLQTEVVEDSTSQRIELRPTSNVANLFYIQETARICYSDTLLIDKTKTEDAVGFLPVAGRLWHLKTELL